MLAPSAPRTGNAVTCQARVPPPARRSGRRNCAVSGTPFGPAVRRYAASTSGGKSGSTSESMRPVCSSTGFPFASAR